MRALGCGDWAAAVNHGSKSTEASTTTDRITIWSMRGIRYGGAEISMGLVVDKEFGKWAAVRGLSARRNHARVRFQLVISSAETPSRCTPPSPDFFRTILPCH